jgi:membrane-associated phospholipid phosphatase
MTLLLGLFCVCVLFAGLADSPLAHWLRAEPLPGDIEKVVLLAEVFAHGLGVLLILITVKSLDPRGWRVVPRLAATAYLAGVSANCLKILLIRRRPNQFAVVPDSPLESFEGFLAPWSLPFGEAFDYATQSFPSAHTATAFGLALGLGRLYPRGGRLFLFFAVLAGVQRMVVQAHFLSDVVVGGGVGLVVAASLQRPSAWTERFFLRMEKGSNADAQAAEFKSLSDRDRDDTLDIADGGNVQQEQRNRHGSPTSIDSDRRCAG